MTAALLLVVAAYVIAARLERRVACASPEKLRWAAVPFARRRRLVLSRAAIDSLSSYGEARGYREPATRGVRWSHVDAAEVAREIARDAATAIGGAPVASFSPRAEEAVVAVRPSRRFTRSAPFWVYVATLRVTDDHVEISPRLYVGGIVPKLAVPLALAFVVGKLAAVVACVALSLVVVEVIISYADAKGLAASMHSCLAKLLEGAQRVEPPRRAAVER